MTARFPFFLRRWEWRVFWAVFFGTALYFIVARADFFFGPAIFEAGDDAANALQILRAKHGIETLGNYSRFHFHHPGPAFFYVYALGELFFRDLCRIVASPGQAHVLTGVLLQSTFFAATFSVIASYRHSLRLVLLLGCVALVHFRLADRAFLSTWPPHQLLMPFLCLIVAASSVAAGRLAHLPLLVLASGFLIHGHVSQPLFVGLIWSAAALIFWIRERRAPVRIASAIVRSVWISAGIATLFAIPLLLELARGGAGNFGAIAAHLLHYKGDYKTLSQSLFYFAQFLTYWPYHAQPYGDWHDFVVKNFAIISFWILILACGARLVILVSRRRRNSGESANDLNERERRFFIALSVMTTLAFAASIIWGVKMDGPMWSFNGFINYAITFLFLAAPVLLIDLAVVGRRTFVIPEGAALLAVVLLPTAHPVQMQELSSGFGMNDDAVGLLIGNEQPPKRQLLWSANSVWIQTPSLALGLARRGIDFRVRPELTLLCGAEHLGTPAESLRHPRTDAAWLLGTKTELAPYFDELFDLGHGCSAQRWQKIKRVGSGADVPFTNDLLFIDGFGAAEKSFRWSIGKRSSMFLPLVAGDQDVTLRFGLNALLEPQLKTAQRVTVRAGENRVADWSVTAPGDYVALIPAAVLRDQVAEFGGVILDFDLPDACSPQSLKINADTRVLGIAVRAITVL